jgi:type VI secretion system protein ImpK
MGSNKDSSYGQTLAVICDDLFSLIAYLREVADIDQPEVFYDRAIELFASMEDRARQLKIPDADVRDAKYAIVAIIDENMGWASRLEQEFFRRNVAGEEFFTRLEELKKAKGRNEVLEVYYICLALGFEGRYFRSPERIKEYIAELQEMLDLKGPARLSPRGEGSQAVVKRRRGSISSWVPWLVAIAGTVILVGVVILLRIRVVNLASDVIDRIGELLN